MAFYRCIALKEVNLPNSLKELGSGAFEVCSSLGSIDVPESITILNDFVFRECESLTSVKLPQNLTTIGVNAFFCCYGLTSVELPESLNTIKDAAFYCCRNLEHVNLPESLVFVGAAAFKECYALTSITLPASLEVLGEIAFEFCNLTEVNYNAVSLITASDDVFSDFVYRGATLNTPNATLATVQATEPWKRFLRINASDGSVAPTEAGEDFSFDGIVYTVIDQEAKTCKTKDASADFAGNTAVGNLVIPDSVSYNGYTYAVKGIGNRSFNSCSDLYSVSIPATVENFGIDAFADCERLTSIEWKGSTAIPESFIREIGNANLLLFVDSIVSAPEGMTTNVVAGDICESLVLTPGYPFKPLHEFTALRSSMTKEFTQPTPIDGCAGWETIVLPFEAKSIVTFDGRPLTPFAAISDIDNQYPFWLYEADPAGMWRTSDSIRAGIPYILSMPNNDEYSDKYRIDGSVRFFNDYPTLITPETASPYSVTWNSGQEFRSLWLPLSESEAAQAMGLNTGIEGLTDDNGMLLAPGSAFHAGVMPRPLEAYVTRAGGQRVLKIGGSQSFVLPLLSGESLNIGSGEGLITVSSARDCRLGVYTPAGVLVRMLDVKAGETYTVGDLTKGIYIVAGRKITVR